MERSLTLTFTIDDGVAQSADGSLLWNLVDVEEAEFLIDDASDSDYYDDEVSEDMEIAYYDDDLSVDMIAEAMMQLLGDLLARETQEAHQGGAGEEGAVFVPSSSAAVAGLEKRAFHATAEGRDSECGVTGCAICLVDFEDGEEVTVMPCFHGHGFHPQCITVWLGKGNTCPLCRHALQPADVMDDWM